MTFIFSNGSEWARIRKTFQKGLSGPSESLSFITDSDEVIKEWIHIRLGEISQKTESDFLPELSRLFLECKNQYLQYIVFFLIFFQCLVLLLLMLDL